MHLIMDGRAVFSCVLPAGEAAGRSVVTLDGLGSIEKPHPILTFKEAPSVEVHLINRPEEKPLGSGEASSGPAAAAVANAVSHALGRRVRDLPLDPERIKAAGR